MSPIDKSKPIYINCVYVTHHPATGRFYIGKGQTRKIINKKYVGSGKRLRNEIMKDIHCVDNRICDPTGGSPEWLANKAYAYGWESEVLQTFRNKNDAFAFETELIHENQNDPLNLNDGYTRRIKKTAI